MAKVVIAGKSDCPYFARVELLGDNLRKNLPSFHLHKIVKKPNDWDAWLKELCDKNSWTHSKSPIVWRELIDRGGKGVLIGGANDFQEYANIYYGYMSNQNSDDVRKIATENEKTKIELDEEDIYYKGLSKPMQICVTDGSKGVAYSLLKSITDGDIFGQNKEISIHLLCNDEQDDDGLMQGAKLEIQDMAQTLVRDVVVTCDVYEAFCDCEVIVILDSLQQNEDEDKAEFFNKNAALFKRYALAANQVAKTNCKVIVSGSGPVNFNTSVFKNNCTDLQTQNIVGLSRFTENNCRGILGDYLKVNSVCVSNVIVWGNINNPDGRYIDMQHIQIHKYDGAIWGPPSFSLPVLEIIWDNKWLDTFTDLMKERQGKIEEALRHGSFMSQAAAISTFMYDWWNGCKEKVSSAVVQSKGWYGVPDGLMFSFPVRLHPDGYWVVVEDIEIDETTQDKIKQCVLDLQNEQEMYRDPGSWRLKLQALEDEKTVAAEIASMVSGVSAPMITTSSASKETVTKNPSLERIVEELIDDSNSRDINSRDANSRDANSRDAISRDGVTSSPSVGDTKAPDATDEDAKNKQDIDGAKVSSTKIDEPPAQEPEVEQGTNEETPESVS